MPLVSIGLPVYNGEKYISEALESILSQTEGAFEIIVSDNASTDSTPSIIKRFMDSDRRIKYYRNQQNLGAAFNYNRTVELATGEFFKWASYDDLMAPTFLEKCLNALNDNPGSVLAYPRTILIDSEGKEITSYNDNLNLYQRLPHQRLSHLITKINLANPVLGLIRTENLRRTQGIGKFVGSDYVTLIELCLQGTFQEVPEHLFLRRDHGTNIRRYTPREKAEWWDPVDPVYENYRIRLFKEMIRAVSRSGLRGFQKARCLLQLNKWPARQLRAAAGKRKAWLLIRLGLDSKSKMHYRSGSG